MSDPRDLSGVWYGRYEGAGVPPNGFIAVLAEAAGAVSGSISEPDDLGMAQTRRAVVAGQRDGTAVAFTKQYDGEVLAHAVDYAGTIDGAGTEVRGEWSFEHFCGTFAMARSAGVAESVERSATVGAKVR